MFSCDHNRHPFANDPGTSQGDRVGTGLSEGATPIDGRQLSDLLNYFRTLADQINFYYTRNKKDILTGSWKPFFANSLPFLLSSISTYAADQVRSKMAAAEGLFREHPSADGLELLLYQTYYTTIYPLQQWSLGLGTETEPGPTLQTLIRDRLAAPVKEYIQLANTAAARFGVQAPDFAELAGNGVWGLDSDALAGADDGLLGLRPSDRAQLLHLQGQLASTTGSFIDVLNVFAPSAASAVNTNLYGLLTANGQQNVPPHLALLFSFLSQFLNVQADLNGLPGKHLKFYFEQVLKLAPEASTPDHAYLIFALPKQKPNYVVTAGTKLKAGKDKAGADISFSVDEDVYLNQTQVSSLRTVFVNKQQAGGVGYIEGVYMAPDATMADGISKPLKDPSTMGWPTLGAMASLYTAPGASAPAAYPSARLGFVLASKVLLMKEGTRHVDIQLACTWKNDICGGQGPAFSDLFPQMQEAIASEWLIITGDGLDKAQTMGVQSDTIKALKNYFLKDPCTQSICDPTSVSLLDQTLIQLPAMEREVAGVDWLPKGSVQDYEAAILEQVFVPQSMFTVSFSGEKGWVAPERVKLSMDVPSGADAGTFTWNIRARVGADEPAITFYNASKLGEDLGTTDPVVKIELNDAIKWELSEDGTAPVSCLQQVGAACGKRMSSYEFLRSIVLLPFVKTSESPINTQIQVTVCGVTTLVVQNDDNVLDPNKNFAPFGMKPAIVDFDVYPVVQPNIAGLNLVGNSFLIGSAEILLKKWDRLYLHMDWVGKPSNFNDYYSLYIQHNHVDLNTPGYQVNLALLHDGAWYKEGTKSPCLIKQPSKSITDSNRALFPDKTPCRDTGFGVCGATSSEYTFAIEPEDFAGLPSLDYDPSFAPFTQYSTTIANGFLRLTLEYQDFFHKIYPWVLSRHVIDQTHHNDKHHPAPNEPWTPMLQKGMSIDYQATAMPEDMSLIQLYPFQGAYKAVDIAGEQTLFATFCNEGNLFIGLTGLVAGDTLSILFQLAEATGDTEGQTGMVSWYFLSDNSWKPLNIGFEILEDGTSGLTTTGIIRFALPDSISSSNTILPGGQCWLWASLDTNTEASSRALGVIAQAVAASYLPQPANDPQRAATPVVKGTISKLLVPDANISKVSQPFDSFGGSAPEDSGSAYYQRVSERTRHKGRAIQKWDYERLVLQQFPEVLCAKCIHHSLALENPAYRMDFSIAPGNIVLAVLPDTRQMAVADNLRPTVPTSTLTAIGKFLADKQSPFVQVLVRNPRYEPVDICVTILLKKGADPDVAKARLVTDLQNYLAPWLSGDMASFRFAQRLYLSAIAELVESRDYIVSVSDLKIARSGGQPGTPEYIDPMTPRSIIVAGSIGVKVGSAGASGSSAADGTGVLFWKKRLKK